MNPKAKWSNGETMTASDYVWSWNRALHPDTGSLYAYMLYPIVNSEAYSKREITDFRASGCKGTRRPDASGHLECTNALLSSVDGSLQHALRYTLKRF
jgi:ABC-type transport system substrate-binding protein